MKRQYVAIGVLVLLLAASLAMHLTASGQSPEVPDLTGTWVGTTQAIKVSPETATGEELHSHAEPGLLSLGITYEIDFQEGPVFSGTKSSQQHSEPLAGTIGADNKSIWIVDQDGYFFAQLISEDRIETIYLEAGDAAMVAGQGIFIRQEEK